MINTRSRSLINLRRFIITLSVFSLSPLATAVAPLEANFIMGLDVQGQRLNLYNGCTEGNVTCDNMLLVAPNLGDFLQISEYGKRIGREQSTIDLYPTKTKHSICKDGVTPCCFQGYIFEGEDFNGFIDTSKQQITVNSNWTMDTATLSYQKNDTYLPLVSQSQRVNRIYQTSDKALNESYKTTSSEARRLYGKDSASELYKEQIEWIKKRSDICSANVNHLPRNQAEKVCFIQKNTSRMNDYFLWID